MKHVIEIVRAAIFGHAIADAMGVPVEFCSRDKRKLDPVTDYRAYGTYHQPAGTWSDDTSMTLASLNSLTCGLDYEDIMTGIFSAPKTYTPSTQIVERWGVYDRGTAPDVGRRTVNAALGQRGELPEAAEGGRGGALCAAMGG